MKHNRFQLKIEKLEQQLAEAQREMKSAVAIIQQVTKMPEHLVIKMIQEYGVSQQKQEQ